MRIPIRAASALLSALLGCAAAAPAGAAEPRLAAAWSRTRGEAGDWYEYKTAAVSAQGEVWVGFGARDLTTRDVVSWIWRLGPAGEDLGVFRIAEPPGQPTDGPRYSDVKAIASLDNGELLAVVAFGADQPWLLRFSRDGQQLAARNIVGRGREVGVKRLLATPDGNYLLLGHEASNALAVKIDPTGKVLWEKKDDRGKTELFVDGWAEADGSLVVVGNSGNNDYRERGDSSVWIATWDKDGNPRAEKVFPGREGSVARAADGSYALAYDRSASDARRIRLQPLGAGLAALEGADVIEIAPKAGRAPFKVLPAPRGGGFIVAGARDYLPWLGRPASKAGAPTVMFFDETIDPGVTHEVLPAPDGFFVASSILRRSTGKPAHQALRLMRLVYR